MGMLGERTVRKLLENLFFMSKDCYDRPLEYVRVHVYLNGLATLNLYSLGDCPLACLPQIMDEYMQCRYQVLKKEAIQ